MHKTLVVRAKPHNINREDQFLDGIASIGWPTSESFGGKDWDEIKKILEDHESEKEDHEDKKIINSIAVTQIHSFVHLPEGSFILTPSCRNRDIHILKTISEYQYKEEWSTDDTGNPHTVKAALLKSVHRSVFSAQVQRALLAAKKTVTDFSKYSEEIATIVNDNNDDDKGISESAAITSSSEIDLEVQETLRKLLKSKNEEVRLKATLALWNKNI